MRKSLPGSGGGAGTPPDGNGGGSGSSSDDEKIMYSNDEKNDDSNKDSKESGDKDPIDAQDGRDNTPKTTRRKEITKMLLSFCHLTKSSANAIVVYFGVSKMDKLADIHEEHWKDMFVRWQNCHTWSDSMEHAIISLHHNKTGSCVWHGLAIITIVSVGLMAHS